MGTIRVRHSWSLALTALVAVAGLGACSVSVGKTLDKATLEQQVATSLAKQANQPTPPKVTCPGDLEAKKGAKTQCVVVDNGDRLPVDVTVTSVGDKVGFDIKVGTTPLPS